jgi:hypothetical protein
MTSMLIPLALNELLGFVRLSHSALPEPSCLILPFNLPTAHGDSSNPIITSRFMSEAHTIQDSLAFNVNFLLGKDSRLLF